MERDLIDILIEDHQEVEQLFMELEKGSGDAGQRRRLANVVIAELVRHSVAEEQYLYPTVRRAMPDGDRLADHEIAEHAEAERLMKDLEDLDAAGPDFARVLSQLMSTIRHHVLEEETDLFPRLRSSCTEEDLRELGRKVERAKKLAPTRPHPNAPDEPPWNKILAPGAGLVDRVRDALTGRATSMDDI